jgi:proteasome lid subunit RPN8/RPN11
MNAPSWKNTSLVEDLASRLTDVERAGFVLATGEVIELTNIAAEPQSEFRAADAELMEHIDGEIAALWHTHPAGTSVLSAEDWKTFLDWPGAQHIIVAADGVRFYGVKGRGVIHLPGVAA